MEAPSAGESIECVQIHGRVLDRGATRAIVTGTETTVVLEWSRTPDVGPRRVHLRDEIDRTSARLWDLLQRLAPAE